MQIQQGTKISDRTNRQIACYSTSKMPKREFVDFCLKMLMHRINATFWQWQKLQCKYRCWKTKHVRALHCNNPIYCIAGLYTGEFCFRHLMVCIDFNSTPLVFGSKTVWSFSLCEILKCLWTATLGIYAK